VIKLDSNHAEQGLIREMNLNQFCLKYDPIDIRVINRSQFGLYCYQLGSDTIVGLNYLRDRPQKLAIGST
jgi:hypothetical protein